jgi:hypothetical protein
VEAVEAVGAVVTVVGAGTGGDYGTAAVFAGKGFIAGVGFVVALFILSALVFTIHSLIPRFIVYRFIISDLWGKSIET